MSIIEKIKLLFAIRKPVMDLVNQTKEIKTGWKTIGFWISIVGTLGAVAGSVAGFIPASQALIATTAITVVYNILRAFQNANQPGVTPVLQSTRFWVGLLGIVATGLESLKSGGVNPEWVSAAAGLIAAVMAASQSLGANQPEVK